MGYYNDRSDYNPSDAGMGKLGELLVLRLELNKYKDDSNCVVYYANEEEDSKKVGDVIIYNIANDFVEVKEIECRSVKDFKSLQKYYLLSHRLMTEDSAESFTDVNIYPTGINVPDKSFYSLRDTVFKIPDPDNPESFILNRKLTKKELREATYCIVSEEDIESEFPKNMIEIKINKIINSTTDNSDNIRQKNELFHKVGYTVADYISIHEDTNEKFYHAD